MRTEQKPLISGFGPRTTAEEALAGRDLREKVAIVTGGHAGLGQARRSAPTTSLQSRTRHPEFLAQVAGRSPH